MKVLHIIPSITVLRGGSNIAVVEIVKALRQIDIDAEVVTSNDNLSTLLDVPLNYLVEYQEIPIRFFSKIHTKFTPIDEYTFSLTYVIWLYQNIQKYDVIHIHSFFSFFCTIGAIIARQKKVKYIITPHGQLDNWVVNQGKLKKQLYTILLEKKNIQNAAAIHCTTEQEAQDVVNFGITTPTSMISLGVNSIIEIPDAKNYLCKIYNLSSTIPIILFLSRLHQKKNLEFLLEILSHVKDKRNFHLIIAGTGNIKYVQYIKALAFSLNLKSYCTFTGFVSGRDKALLLQGADIFTLPSFGENFCLVLLEAMASGLPAIITPEIQISSDILAENAGLIVPRKLENWVQTINYLLDSPEIRYQLGRKAKSLVTKKYNWSVTAEALITLYNQDLRKGTTCSVNI